MLLKYNDTIRVTKRIALDFDINTGKSTWNTVNEDIPLESNMIEKESTMEFEYFYWNEYEKDIGINFKVDDSNSHAEFSQTDLIELFDCGVLEID